MEYFYIEISSWVGRTGNNILQIIRAIDYCLKDGSISYLVFPKHNILKENKIIFNDNLANNCKLKDTFFYHGKNLEPYQYRDIHLKYIKNLINIDKIELNKEDLYIHMRSGDIFKGDGIHQSYIQPPVYFYEQIIEKYLEKNIYILSEDKNNVVIVSTEELTLEETIKIAENTFKNLDTRDLLIGDSNNLITSDKDRDIMSDVNSSPMYFQMEGEGIVAQLMVAMVQMTTLKGMVSPSIGKIGVKEGYNNWYVFYPNVEKVDIDLIRREIDNYEENA